MLSPKVDEEGSSYYVISGEHGTGKTTMIKKVAQEIGGGVIYVNVPGKVEKFDEAFATETGCSFRSNSGLNDFIHGMIYKDGSETKKGICSICIMTY